MAMEISAVLQEFLQRLQVIHSTCVCACDDITKYCGCACSLSVSTCVWPYACSMHVLTHLITFYTCSIYGVFLLFQLYVLPNYQQEEGHED